MKRRDFLQWTAGTAFLAAAGGLQAHPAGRPKKSLLLSMLPRDLSIEEKFALAKRVGFEGIEVSPVSDPEQQTLLREASKKTGLIIHSVIYGGWGKNHLGQPDPKAREEGVEKLKAGLRGAKAVGAEVLLLVPAVVDANVRYAEAYERSQEEIRKVLPVAEECGVVIGIENVWNNFLLSPVEFAKYVDEFKSKFVQAYFDVGNVVKHGWPQDWIRTLGKRICRVHIKDFKREGQKFVLPTEGDVDWKEVRKAFEEIGYESYCTAELQSGNEKFLQDISQRLDKILLGE